MTSFVHLRGPRCGAAIAGAAMLLAGLTLMLAPVAAAAQYSAPPPPAAWALDNVRVTHADGRVEEGVTLVVRGGIIETLAAGAPVPADARHLAWTEGTLHVYPGFVDAHGGVEPELPTPSRDGVQSWNPTRAVQFFTPHREAASFLTATGESLASERRRGVVVSAVFPGRGILPGQPSVILHRADARTSGELVVNPSMGLAAAWQGAQGAYPGTLMAQHALLRQSFLDAEHYRAHREAWERDGQGMPMPTRDADYEWLLRAAEGEVPIYFQASGTEDIRRVLNLSDELGFRPVIVGGSGSGPLADELARRGISVLLDAGFPSPQQWDPESAPATPAADRERQRLEPIFRTPAQLAEAGVPFVFTSAGSSGTGLLDGARRAIEFGLPEAAALAALTGGPAAMLGVESVARIVQGGAATFVVTDRPLFDEGARIVWTFVNGQAEKGQDPESPRSADADEPGEPGAGGVETGAGAQGLAGSWTGSLSVVGNSLPISVRFEDTPQGLRGTLTSDQAPPAEIRDITVEGDRVRFSFSSPQAQGATSVMEAVLQGDRMTGTGTVQFGDTSVPLTFELRRDPEGELR